MRSAPARPLPSKRLGRAALFAFGLTVATSSALDGCSDDGDDSAGDDDANDDDDSDDDSSAGKDSGSNSGVPSDGQVVALYGAPAPRDASMSDASNPGTPKDAAPPAAGKDAGSSDAAQPDASSGDSGKPDASASDGGRVLRDSAVIALYGLPPAPPTGVVPLYGAPTQGESN